MSIISDACDGMLEAWLITFLVIGVTVKFLYKYNSGECWLDRACLKTNSSLAIHYFHDFKMMIHLWWLVCLSWDR